MCVLCGDLAIHTHWTEGVRREHGESTVYVGGDGGRLHRRDRVQVVSVLNEILQFYGLKASDWNGVRYLVSDMKGQTVIAQNLGQVWVEAEKLSSRHLDPLDKDLLTFISQAD